MGPIIIAAVAILAVMAMRKKPDTVASSTSTAGQTGGSGVGPFKTFIPGKMVNSAGEGFLADVAACYAGLSASDQQLLTSILSDPKTSPANLIVLSRGFANQGKPQASTCIYNLAKARLLACAPTSGVAMYMENAVNAANVSPGTLETAAQKLENNLNPPAIGAAKCLRDFSLALFPGQVASSGQGTPNNGQIASTPPVPAWLGKLMGT